MANDYVTLAAVKEALKITDGERDTLLTQNIAAASRWIDKVCGRRFWLDAEPVPRTVNPTRRVAVDSDGAHLLIPDIGSVDGLVVEVGRRDTWTDITDQVDAEPDDALLDGRPVTSLLHVLGRWSTGAGQRVRITARWGWPEVPDVIAQATMLQATRLYKRKDSPEGVTGSAEWGVVRLSRVDPDVYALIEKHIIHGMG